MSITKRNTGGNIEFGNIAIYILKPAELTKWANINTGQIMAFNKKFQAQTALEELKIMDARTFKDTKVMKVYLRKT